MPTEHELDFNFIPLIAPRVTHSCPLRARLQWGGAS